MKQSVKLLSGEPSMQARSNVGDNYACGLG